MKRKELLARPIAPAPAMQLKAVEKKPYKYKNGYGQEFTQVSTTLNYKYACQLVGDNILETTVYTASGEPICRTWQDGEKIISQTLPDGKGGESTMENLYQRLKHPEYKDYWWHTRRFYSDEATLQVQQKYFDNYELQKHSGFEQIIQSQRLIRKEALEERYDRIRQSIDNVMLQIRPLPKAFEDWVENTALKHSRYLFYHYQKGAKAMLGWCSHCRQEVSVTGARHKQQGRCPNCKSPVTYIAKGRFFGFTDEVLVSYLQKTPDGCCIRQFIVDRFFPSDDWTRYSTKYYEEIRNFFSFEQLRVVKRFEWASFKNTGQYRWCHSGWSCRESLIYPRNLKKLFANTRWQYVPMADIARHCGAINAEKLLQYAAEEPGIEHLAKHSFWGVIAGRVNGGTMDEYINFHAKGIRQVLGLPRDEIRMLKPFNPTLSSMHHLHRLRKIVMLSVPLLKWLIDDGLLNYSATVIKVLKYTSWKRLAAYLSPQITNFPRKKNWNEGKLRPWEPCEVLAHYSDYLEMAEKLGWNLKDEFVLFPRNLQGAHDRAVETNNIMKALEEEKKHATELEPLLKVIEQHKCLEFTTEDYLIRLPAGWAEIVNESLALHHCVSNYAGRMARGETLILFIRSTAAPNTPLVTVELNPKTLTIVQHRGNRNSDPTPEVLAFIKKWKKAKLHKQTESKTA